MDDEFARAVEVTDREEGCEPCSEGHQVETRVSEREREMARLVASLRRKKKRTQPLERRTTQEKQMKMQMMTMKRWMWQMKKRMKMRRKGKRTQRVHTTVAGLSSIQRFSLLFALVLLPHYLPATASNTNTYTQKRTKHTERQTAES